MPVQVAAAHLEVLARTKSVITYTPFDFAPRNDA